MLNGFRICHGGFISTLQIRPSPSLQQLQRPDGGGGLCGFHRPGEGGRHPDGEASEVALTGRTGIYDVTVRNQRGELVATFGAGRIGSRT